MKFFSSIKMSDGYQLAVDKAEKITKDTILSITIDEYTKVLALVTYIEEHEKVLLVDVVIHPDYNKKVDLTKAKDVEVFGELKINT